MGAWTLNPKRFSRLSTVSRSQSALSQLGSCWLRRLVSRIPIRAKLLLDGGRRLLLRAKRGESVAGMSGAHLLYLVCGWAVIQRPHASVWSDSRWGRASRCAGWTLCSDHLWTVLADSTLVEEELGESERDGCWAVSTLGQSSGSSQAARITCGKFDYGVRVCYAGN